MIATPHPTGTDRRIAVDEPAVDGGRPKGARPPNAAMVVASVLALAAVVAVASGGATVWAAPRRGAMDRLDVALVMMVLAVLVVPVTIGASAVVRRRFRPSARATPLRASTLRAVPLAAVTLAVTSLATITWMEAVLIPPAPGAPPLPGAGFVPELMDMSDWFHSAVTAGEGQPDDRTAAEPEPDGSFRLGVVAVGLALALVAGVVARLLGRRTRGPAGTRDDEDRATAHRAVLGTIDAMLADPDPRTAIIGAYARLLEGLEAIGTGRRDYEAPMEHMARALAVLRVRPEPLQRLIALFQAARFSTHTLTPAHRDEALDALREVAGDLSAGTAAVRASAVWRPVGRPS